MKASDLKEILRICRRIGIELVSELQDFARREQRPGESLLDALKRYELEVFYE
uniref:Glycosylhydrolase n=1 Tax=Siphoviridae sp. ctnMR5 TaxID=2825658 RepID=A0A8S5U8R4_9CAUD|nr:MAG TPA: glycosylhydrolase [Siphoviridae sp. ctnMR5]